MRLQCEAHQRQEKILKIKWKSFELQKEKARKEREKKQLEMKLICSEKENISVEELEVFDGKKLTSPSASLVISAENFSVASSVSSISETSATKDEKNLDSKFQSQVSELKIQVLSLSQELEDTNRQNAKLKQTIQTLKDFITEQHGEEMLVSLLENTNDVSSRLGSIENINSCSAEENDKVGTNFLVMSESNDRMSQDSQKSEELAGSSELGNIEDFMQHTLTEKQQQTNTRGCVEPNGNKISAICLPPLEVPQFHFVND